MTTSTKLHPTTGRIAPVLAGVLLGMLAASAAGPDDAPWVRGAFVAEPAEMIRAASSLPAVEGADVQVLLDEERIVFDEAGRKSSTHRLVSRILTPSGVRAWGTTAVPWSPWYQDRPVIRARVVTADGVAHELDPKSIDESPASGDGDDVFDNRRVLRAPLPAVAAGAILEEEMVTREASPFFDRGEVAEFYFGKDVPVRRTRLTVEAPATLPLKRVVRLLPRLEERREESAGVVRYTFENGPIEALKPSEPFLPPEVPWWPAVSLSTGRSWGEIAARYSQIVEQQIAGADLKKLVHDSTGKAKSRQEIARSLLEILHKDVRYTGVEFDEAAIVPRPPSETLRRKYGDCKDQAALLVAMLRAAGVPARVALLRAGEGPDVDPDLPGLGVFDHAIVRVAGEPPLWIDPTDPYAASGDLPTPDQGRLALEAAPGTTGLQKTPESAAADNRTLETREFFLAEEGEARVVETTEVWGAPERNYRRYNAEVDRDKIKKGLEEYVKGRYRAKKLEKYEATDPSNVAIPFRLTLEATGAARGTTSGGEAAVAIEPGPITAELPEEIADAGEKEEPRVNDLFLPKPFRTEWHYRIVPPPGFAPRPLPESEEKSLGPAKLSKSFAAGADGTITADLRFEIPRRRLSPGEVRELQKSVRELKKERPILLTFGEIGEVHLGAGRIKEALDEFNRLAALHPKEALHRTDIARALLAGGMGEAARDEARRAVALDPSSAVAERVLGWVLSNDLVGRPFNKGCDLAAAEKAYRKAKELDASDAPARGNLAILLEYDPGGTHFGPKARMTEAIAEYRSLRGDLDDRRFDFNLLVDLARTGDFKGVRQFALELDPGQARDIYLVLASSATEGVEAAIRQATSLATTTDARSALLLGAARWQMTLRNYPVAAVLFSEGAKGAANGANVLSLADMLRKTRRHEDLALSEDEPMNVVKRLMLVVFDPDASREKLLPLLARSVAAGLSDHFTGDDLRRLRQGISAPLEQAGMPGEVALDLALGFLQASSEGDDAVGYRLRLQGMAGMPGNAMDLFLLREEGKYRILAVGSDPWDMGGEVLRRLDAGDEAGARRWLEWAREEVPRPPDDDPLAGAPFLLFWKKGSTAGPDGMRRAAASLLAVSDAADRALPILQDALAKATTDEERLRCQHALATAYQKLGRVDDMVRAGRILLALRPDSDAGFSYLGRALVRARGWDECRRLAGDRLKQLPDDIYAIRILALVAGRTGDFETEEKLYGRLVETGKAEASDLNNLAWLALFRGRVTDKATEQAQRAVVLTRQGNAADLHTLAALYAEAGKTAEARELILKEMQMNGSEEPRPDDWYVFGRIAEQYGVREAAVSAYAKVTPPGPDTDVMQSTYTLAQKRLGALKKGAGGRRAAAESLIPGAPPAVE